MALLNPLHSQEELSSPPKHQKLETQAAPKNLIPKLYDIAFTHLLGELNKVPLSERVGAIQNTPLTVDLKMRFLQPLIEQKLRETETDDALLALFQEIKSLCSFKNEEQEKAVFDADIFTLYMKPLIQKVAENQRPFIEVEYFLSKTVAHSEDISLSEMFGLWHVVEIKNQEELSFICQKQTFIRRIIISYKIRVEGTRALAEALKENKMLTSLDLCGNRIEVEGARALAEALKENKTLTSLDLRSNKIGVEGARALVDTLKVNETLTSLDLSSNQIGVEGARALVDTLKKNKTLTSLILGFNEIRYEGATALAEALKENKTLTSLCLRNNQIGDEGARDLADALKVNKTLTSLDLGFNQIGDKGAKAFAEVLKESKTLTSLDLVNNQIGVDIKQLWQEMRALYPTRDFQF